MKIQLWVPVVFLSAMGSSAFSGCSSAATLLECPAPKGVTCQSVSAVNAHVEGQLQAASSPLPVTSPPTASASASPLTVWIAPYTDGQGIEHREQTLRAPAKTNTPPESHPHG